MIAKFIMYISSNSSLAVFETIYFVLISRDSPDICNIQ